MIHLDLILFVDNNSGRVMSLKEKLHGKMESQSCRVAVNGEHGLLCLDHFEMVQAMKGKKVLVILNLETPLVDGFYFLDNLKSKQYSSKNKIAILALDVVSDPEILNKAFQKGIHDKMKEEDDLSGLVASLAEYFTDKDGMKFRIPDKPKNLPLTIL